MPELPEVESARTLVQTWCIGRSVVEAIVANDTKVIDGILFEDLQTALKGRSLAEANRKGKQLWITFDQGPSLLLHLGMTGHVAVKGQQSLKYMLAKAVDINEWPPKYCKLEMILSGDVRMAFCDSRRFAKVKFVEACDMEECLPSGWDALLEKPTLEQLVQRVGKKRVPVKSLLLDQGAYAGIGNWCADDILLEAKIHPQELACHLDVEQLESLRTSIPKIMTTAVACGADSNQYPKHWLFHSRWAPKAAAPHVSFMKIGGRTTALDESTQKLKGQNQQLSGSKGDSKDDPADQRVSKSSSSSLRKSKSTTEARRIAPKRQRKSETSTPAEDKASDEAHQDTVKKA